MHEQIARWWNGVSLRTKITGLTVLLLTVGLAVAGIGTMSLLSGYLIEEVDTRVDSAVNDVVDSSDFVQVDPATCMSSNVIHEYFIAVIDSGGDVACSNRTTGPVRPDLGELTATTVRDAGGRPFTISAADGSHQWRVEARDVRLSINGVEQPSTIVVGLDLESTNAVGARFAAIFLFFAVAVIVLGGVATRLLVTSTFAPLREVERTAARFADGDFSQRMSGALPNTEVGRLNQSLNLMLARIDRAFSDRAATIEQMRRFISDASHELRTPLVSVRGYAELYRIGAIASDDDVASAMDRIEKEAVRMSELVRDLLELARLDETRPLDIRPIHLDVIAHDAAMDIRAQAPDRQAGVVTLDFHGDSLVPVQTGGIEIVTGVAGDLAADGSRPSTHGSDAVSTGRGRRVPRSTRAPRQGGRLRLTGRGRSDGAGAAADARGASGSTAVAEPLAPIVWGEENKIRQVVTNLVGNALRYSTPGTAIELGIGADPRRNLGVIAIIDHGDGIPPQLRDKIFQRFWRADTSRTRETGGSGLGLAIVSAIVASHGGRVEVDETPGGGATFRVLLPLVHNDQLST